MESHDNRNVPLTASGASPTSTATLATESRDSIRFRPSKVFMALPAYNEEESLPELLERIGEAFADSKRSLRSHRGRRWK